MMRMRFPVAIYRVAERSMEPAIMQGDYLLVLRTHKKFKAGDVVVLRHPTKDMEIVKRIRSITSDGIFVTGDNDRQSDDSRSFGPVSARIITGKMLARI